MKVDLVFQGGGAKGIAYVGALRAFEQHEPGLDMRRLVGTSAGAINVALLAAGYSYKEMAEVLNDTDAEGQPVFDSFMAIPKPSEFEDVEFNKTLIISALELLTQAGLNKLNLPAIVTTGLSWVQPVINWVIGLRPVECKLNFLLERIPEGWHDFALQAFNLIERGGIFSARKFMDWMFERLESKGLDREITFRHLFEHSGKDLTLVGSDITGQQMLVLNHMTTPDLPVAWAVRMSMNIPFVWDPVVWQPGFGRYNGNNIEGHRIVDGGALSNFAIRLTTSDDPEVRAVMDNERFPPNDAFTLGFILDSNLPVPDAPPAPGPEAAEQSKLMAFLNIIDYVRTDMTNPTNALNTFKELLLTMMVATDNLSIAAHTDQICRLPVQGFGTLEFGMTEERREALKQAAFNTTQQFLNGIPELN